MPPASWAPPSPLPPLADSSFRSFLSFPISNRRQCALRIPIHLVAASLLRPSSPPCTPPAPLRPQAGTGNSDNGSPGQQEGPLTRARQALRRPGGPRAGRKRPRSGVGTWPAAEPRSPMPRPLRAAAPARPRPAPEVTSREGVPGGRGSLGRPRSAIPETSGAARGEPEVRGVADPRPRPRGAAQVTPRARPEVAILDWSLPEVVVPGALPPGRGYRPVRPRVSERVISDLPRRRGCATCPPPSHRLYSGPRASAGTK